jgi:hypothetical protein
VVKKKLTLSVREDLVDEVKKLATINGKSLSSIVEEYFEGMVFERWAELLGKELGLGGLEPTTESEVPTSRPKGLDAAKIVRELREGRGLRVERG